MTSKYDTYWQDHLDAILVLFDQAHAAGTSAQLPLTGLDALGERGSWYGKLEIVNDRAVYHSAAHMQALGQALEGRLAGWARTSCWVITVDKEVQMAVTQVEPPRTNWFENAYRNAKQTEVIQHAEAYLGPLAQEAASSGWCQTQSGKRVYVLFTAQKERWLAPRRARLEAVAADGGDVVISLTDETSGRFDLWIIPAVELIAAIQGAGFAPSLDHGNAYNFNLQIDAMADSIHQLNWNIRPYRRESGQTKLTRPAFWPTDGPARAEKVDLPSAQALAKPFSVMFADWREAEWAFDLLAKAARCLGLSGPDDPMGAWTVRRKAGQYHLHFSYGQWLVLGLAGANGNLTLKLALFRDRINLPYTAVEPFIQKEGEKPVSLHYVEAQTLRPIEDTVQGVHEETLGYIKQIFAGWQGSPYHKYTDPLVAQAVFDTGARVRLLSQGINKVENQDIVPAVAIGIRTETTTSQIVTGSAFSVRAFELLKGLHQEPTKAYYHAHKDEFKTEVEEPFQGLMARVAESLPDQARETIETQQGIFARFLKNDWGKGGTWDFYWGAFYPKGGKRTQEAQLFTGIHPGFVHFGFSVGAYASEQRQRFQQNCKTHHAVLAKLLSEVFADERLVFGRTEGITIAADGKVSSQEACTWEEFLTDPERPSSTVAVVLPRATVLHTSAGDLIADIAQTFGRLFPLVLLATETDPLRAIADYIDPPPQPPARQNPAYPLAQCAAETGFAEDELAGWVRAIERKGQAIIYGPPGTGKTFIAEQLAKHLIGGGNGFTELVQFHPAYAYEDFVQGIRPKTLDGGGLAYPTVPGRFRDFCDKASQCQDACVLIIDEINRANLARVFGELMYLLEYRDREVPLAGGGTLRIPPNVRVIGTMNTADRSIALVDHALRRRFAFLALYPNYDILRDFHRRASTGYPVEKLIQALTKLNDAIHDRHYHVGITFFLRKTLADEIADIWRMEIEPYLDEYFFDQPDKADAFRWQRLQADLQP